MVLDTEAFDLRDNAIWHTDVTFNATRRWAVLVARKLPEVGGDTLWVSGIGGVCRLSPALQTLLTGLTATHDFVHSFRWSATAPGRKTWRAGSKPAATTRRSATR